MSNKRERCKNYSEDEKQTLMHIIQQYTSIIEKKESDRATLKEKKAAWTAIADKFNAVSTSEPRDIKQLQNFYSNAKRPTRKDGVEENKDRYPKYKNERTELEDKKDPIKIEGGSYTSQLSDAGLSETGLSETGLSETGVSLPDSLDDNDDKRSIEDLKRIYILKKIKIANFEYEAKLKEHIMNMQIKKLTYKQLLKKQINE